MVKVQRCRHSMVAATVGVALLLLAACSDGGSATLPAQEAGPTWVAQCDTSRVDANVQDLKNPTLPCLGENQPTPLGTRDGKPLVLALWASWCGPCHDEAPELERFYQLHGDAVDLIGVDTADTERAARFFAEEYEFSFPNVFDPEDTVRRDFGIAALPGLIFIHPDGTTASIITENNVDYDRLVRAVNEAFNWELK